MVHLLSAPYFIMSRRVLETRMDQVSIGLMMVGRLARSLGKHNAGTDGSPPDVANE